MHFRGGVPTRAMFSTRCDFGGKCAAPEHWDACFRTECAPRAPARPFPKLGARTLPPPPSPPPRSRLDERGRRLHAAAEALTAGHGGVAATSRATKVARSTIGRGLKDLREPGSLAGKVRRKGAGRPAITTKDPTLLDDLRQLLEPATMGDPMRPLRWVSKSHEKLATALHEMGHKVSASSTTDR